MNEVGIFSTAPAYDRYGSVIRETVDSDGRIDYLDLTTLDAPIIPIHSPSFVYLYDHEGATFCESSTVKLQIITPFVEKLEEYLRTPGAHFVMYVRILPPAIGAQLSQPLYALRSCRIDPPTSDRLQVKPKPMREWLNMAPVSASYPHSCPGCGRPAYVGFNSIECSRACRPEFSK